jgi:hypothetical protein
MRIKYQVSSRRSNIPQNFVAKLQDNSIFITGDFVLRLSWDSLKN